MPSPPPPPPGASPRTTTAERAQLVRARERAVVRRAADSAGVGRRHVRPDVERAVARPAVPRDARLGLLARGVPGVEAATGVPIPIVYPLRHAHPSRPTGRVSTADSRPAGPVTTRRTPVRARP